MYSNTFIRKYIDVFYSHPLLSAIGLAFAFILSFTSHTATADLVKVGGTGSALGSIKHLARAFELQHPNTRVVAIESLGSSGSIKAVTAGALDISLSARPLKVAERAFNLTALEIARTPLVLASMHRHTDFNTSDISKIFDGRLATWPDNSPLRPVLRPNSDAESDLLRAISPDIDRALSIAHQRPGVHIAITDQDSADAIEHIPGAVGTSTLALIYSEQRPIHALPLDGVMPSVNNLAHGRYPYFKPLYLITTQNISAPARAFIAFILSRQGASILSGNGYLLVP